VTDEVFLRFPLRQSAFPEGKVDFLQLVAEKTEEGFPGNPEGFLHRKPPFFKRADNIRPYGNHDDTRRNKSLPCAKGGVANGDGGIVIPSR